MRLKSSVLPLEGLEKTRPNKTPGVSIWQQRVVVQNIHWDRKFINSTTELNSTLSNSGVEFWNLDVEFWNSNSTSKFQIRHLNSTESNLAPLSNL